MKVATIEPHSQTEDNRSIAEVIKREGPRLRAWLRRHAPDAQEVEDILQDAFYELVLAQRLMTPIQHAGAWLYRVARNRLTDRFRRKRSVSSESRASGADDGTLGDEGSWATEAGLDELLPDPAVGPEQAYAWAVLMEQLEAALDALPAMQREVFLAHEIEGRSFQDIARDSGESINTLISRKHYAVLALRQQLRAAYDEALQP